MNKKLLSFLLALGIASAASATELPLIGHVYGRQTTSLSGDWHCITDPQENGYYNYRMKPKKRGYFVNAKPEKPSSLVEYDFDRAPVLRVPGDWNTQDERLFFYEGVVWYQRDFQWTAQPGRRTLLWFGAVNYEALVWVNGRFAGRHEGGFTPFNFDVSDWLREGTNTVILKVDNSRRAEHVPTQIFDWWNYGGITRDVLLVSVPETYLENYGLRLDKDGSIRFNARLDKAVSGRTVSLEIPGLGIRRSFKTRADGTVSARFLVNGIRRWSPDSPTLYPVRIGLDGEMLEDEIGFRTIETRGKEILLNGQPIFLRGVSIHEEKPGGGRAHGAEDARRLLGWAKELGCNFVRLAHYPHNEAAVREADRMGMLVWSEIPVYWTIAWDNPDTYRNAERQLSDMIARDRNRAAVIIWSIANETPQSPSRDRFLSRLATKARSLDDSRLISMAMEVAKADQYRNRLQDNMNAYVDVVAFNQYVGWYRNVEDASKMVWEIPYDKPVIISEFGGGAVAGRHGSEEERWTEEFQERVYRENLAMIDRIEGVRGVSPWILMDFRSPRRPLSGVQDYYNRKGLLSEKGEKKKAFFVLRDWYATKR